MEVFSDYKTYNILDYKIHIISDEINNVTNTIAFTSEHEVDTYYYLGNEAPTLESAIYLYEQLHNVILTDSELDAILSVHNY